MHPWPSASHQYPHWDQVSRPAHRCPLPPWAALGTLLTPSLWDHGCPLGPVMPTALEMHPQRPTKTRILPGTQASLQDLAHTDPAWHWPLAVWPVAWGCAQPLGSARLAPSPGAARGAMASPACSPMFPWGLIPPEGQRGSASCSPPACGLQPACEQVATAASPGWLSPGMGLTAGQNAARLLQKGPQGDTSLTASGVVPVCHTLPRWGCQAPGQKS